MKYRIFLVEDHPIYREGLANFINEEPDLSVCGEADDVAGALDGLVQTQPHLVIIDLQLKASSGFDLIREIGSRWPAQRILVLSMYDEKHYADRVIKAGASGYAMKDKGPETVIEAIRSVLRGQRYASEQVKEQLLYYDMRSSPVETLTDREIQVFQLVGEGKSVADIAHILSRSPKTIHNHIDHIKEKLHLGSRQELYQRAREWVLHPDRI